MTTRSHRLAILILGFCCICWGFSFPTMQIGAAAVSRALRASTDAPISELAIRGTFNGCRFALAGLICLALTPRRFTRITRPDLTGGLAVGAFFGGGMLLQVYGLRYALPSVSSFLTALSVVFAPITQSLLFRRPVGSRVWLSIAIAMAGMIILSAGGAQSSAQGALIQPSPIPYLGEILTILGASLFTAQILAVDHFGQRADPSRLTTVMLLTAGALNLAIGLSTGGTILLRSQTLHLLLHDSSFLWPFTGSGPAQLRPRPQAHERLATPHHPGPPPPSSTASNPSSEHSSPSPSKPNPSPPKPPSAARSSSPPS